MQPGTREGIRAYFGDGIGDGHRSQRSAANESVAADDGHRIRNFKGRKGGTAGEQTSTDFRNGRGEANVGQRGAEGECCNADFGQRIGQRYGGKRRTAIKCAFGNLGDGIGDDNGFQQVAVIERIGADGGDAVRDAICTVFAGVGVEQKRVVNGAAQGAVRQEEIRVIRRKGEGLQGFAAYEGIIRNRRDGIRDVDGCQGFAQVERTRLDGGEPAG